MQVRFSTTLERIMDEPKDEKTVETIVFLPPVITEPVVGKTSNVFPDETTRSRAPDLSKLPPGIIILRKICTWCCCRRPGVACYKWYMLVMTYCFYVTYHISRRPLGVVKNVLHQTGCSPNDTFNPKFDPDHNDTWCAWPPFDQANYLQLYAWLDFTYWISYAVGMFFVGHVAERTDLRKFLATGMMAAGFGTLLFGAAYILNIHNFIYFVFIQLFTGVCQSTGFPSVVTLVSNWFGKTRIGFIFGVWGSHGPVGNILGALLAGLWVNSNWALSFMVPGILVCFGGMIAYLFVIVKPKHAGFAPVDHGPTAAPSTVTVPDEISDSASHAISLPAAIIIPGVMEFAVAFFFGKGVAYTFLLWTPTFIKQTTNVDPSFAAYLSAVFDVGGILGGILAGALSDKTDKPATVCAVMFACGAVILSLMLVYGAVSVGWLITFLVLAGLCINGPSSLITTAVAADLGTRPNLVGNTKAIATVIAVINGTGSLGAAFGPLIAGLIAGMGWQAVFCYLVAAQATALLCISRLTFRELRSTFVNGREHLVT